MPFLIQEAAIEARVAARKATTSASITGVAISFFLVQDFHPSGAEINNLVVHEDHVTGGCGATIAKV